MGHWSPGLWAEVTYFSASGDSDTIVVSCPLKDFYFPVVKMSKNTLIQESEAKETQTSLPLVHWSMNLLSTHLKF